MNESLHIAGYRIDTPESLAADPEVQRAIAAQLGKHGMNSKHGVARSADEVPKILSSNQVSWLEAPGANEAMNRAQIAQARVIKARRRANRAGIEFQSANDEYKAALDEVEKIRKGER